MTKKIYILPVMLVLLFFLGAKIPIQSSDAEYVGAETCLDCHDETYNRIIKTPHFTATIKKDKTKVEYCESCHGPGSIHTDDPEVKGSIISFKDLPSAESAAICLSCHQANHFLKNFKKEKHYRSDDSCLSCHSMHSNPFVAKLLSQPREKLCFSCHQDKVAEFNLPFHHKVQEGRMTCWACHDPHDTNVSSQRLGFKKINENCFNCHPSLKGPFTFEHIGTNVGTCQVCHVPHGSENTRLLRRSNQSFLCLECHSGPSITDSLLGSKTSSFHLTSLSTYQNCTICHVKIHGSYLDDHFLR